MIKLNLLIEVEYMTGKEKIKLLLKTLNGEKSKVKISRSTFIRSVLFLKKID